MRQRRFIERNYRRGIPGNRLRIQINQSLLYVQFLPELLWYLVESKYKLREFINRFLSLTFDFKTYTHV